jgi:ABC-type multidrug transport system ATPase subunit
MSMLELSHATKRFSSGQRAVLALDDVSFELDAGECVAVYGMRRSGRTTLLRVAAGMLPLDAGEARFDGRDLTAGKARALGVEIGYCNPEFDPAHGGSVAEHVALALLARGRGRMRARARATAALARVGLRDSARADPRELQADELVRAGIARAIVTQPRLLLLDEPTNGVDVLERDGILALLRSLADGDGTAVLMTVGEPVAGADRVLALDAGPRRGPAAPAQQAPVVPLRPRRQHVEPVA